MPERTLVWMLASYLAVVNLATFCLFGWDKFCARRAMRRVPEATLLLAASLGGTPAAKTAQAVYRHKTRKEPFRSRLNMILAVQFLALIALGLLFLAM